jgi:hypothetical protein
MREEIERFISSKNNVISAYNIKISVTKDNAARVHELTREIFKLGAINENDTLRQS